MPTKKDIYWFERLDKGYDKQFSAALNAEAIAYFQAKDHLPEYLLSPEASFGVGLYRKSTWKNHLVTLEKWISYPEVKRYYCGFLADGNWPGYAFVRQKLLSLLSASNSALDHTISTYQNDAELVAECELLKLEILQSEALIKKKIGELISVLHQERNPQFPIRQVQLNHFTPVANDEGLVYYQVEFKVIDADLSENEPFGGYWIFLYDWGMDQASLLPLTKEE
ncbi:MAG: hypothetical protein AAGC88_15620 [Bacteroidota bacterium]